MQNPWSFANFNSVNLVGGTSQSLLRTSVTQLLKSAVKSGSLFGSQEIDPDHVSVMSVKATNLKSYGFLVLCNSFNSNSRSVTSAGVNTLTLDSQCVPHQTFVAREKTRKPGQRSGVWHQCGVLDSHCVANLVLTVREDDITQSRANPWSLAYFNSVTLFNHAESRRTCR